MPTKTDKIPKAPKLVKDVKTPAEKAGLPSDAEKAKEIAKVMSKESGINIKVVPPRKKRVLSDEQKQVLRERLVTARAKRAANRQPKAVEA